MLRIILIWLAGMLLVGCAQAAVPSASPSQPAPTMPEQASPAPEDPAAAVGAPTALVELTNTPESSPTAPVSAQLHFAITSPAFADGGAIPLQYTCQGDDSSPELAWGEPPDGARSLALIMDDPDAPGGDWVHWLVYNIPPETRGLAAGASQGGGADFNLPGGALQGVTSFRRGDYGGPCPPSGTHRYFFRLYALDTAIQQPGLDHAGLLAAIKDHILASSELMGTYQQQ